MNDVLGQRLAPRTQADDACCVEPLIACDNLVVRDGERTLLSEVSLEIRPGEVVTIVGPNGGGKTTLLKALIGAVRLQSGQIRRREDLRIGFMPQRLAVDRTLPLTVDGFLRLGAAQAAKQGEPPVSAQDRREALARLGVERLAEAQLANLSSGEMQRALLARATLRRPNLLMLDEPTQGLDQRGEARFYRQLEALRSELGLAVLLVSHDLHVVMGASDRVICLNRHVCCAGAPDQVSAHPEYHRLFDVGPEGSAAIAIYRHRHDHNHDDDHDRSSVGGC